MLVQREWRILDYLKEKLSTQFNSQIFLSQPPYPDAALVPSNVYKFEDFMTALKKLQLAGEDFQFWFGDDCSLDSKKAGLVNVAAFLGQAMRETIIYDGHCEPWLPQPQSERLSRLCSRGHV
jgi:hypothetical protein